MMKKTISAEAMPMAVPSSANLSRYLQLALLVIAAGAIYPMLYLRQVYQSTMLDALAIGNSELGYLYSLLGFAFLVSYLPSGWLADRFSPRYLISFSLLGTGVLGLWYARLPGFQALLAIFCGFGITTGLTFWASLIKRVKMLAGDDEQGRFFGVLDGGRGLIEALLATVAIALFAYVTASGERNAEGLQLVIHFYAACCIALGAVLMLLRDPQGARDEGAAAGKGKLLEDLRVLARIPELWLVTAIVFCGYHFFWATYSFSAYLQEGGFGLSATMAGLITTIKLWMRPVGGIGGGWLGDRFSRAGVLTWAMLLSALGMLGLVLLPSMHQLGVLVFLVIFIGLMTYAIRGLYWAILDDCRIPQRVTGLAIGIISLVGYSPDVFLPLLNGWISDRFPGFFGYQIYFSYVVAVGLLGVVATLILKKRIDKRGRQA
ncbi:MFS transporter [Pseudomonas aeruginosa]|uniref:Major Facilitator Superfamily protein n=2 Tax=Pseudomonas TaxID=286 RepID=A0A2R3IQA3_9PSED|nr:major Facilitator Superfamily protein [Pseudomonas paraeruginosa]KSD60455.1 MFS transporter [Pseudomonas aeruginosa]AWE94916.1 major Facilitator Superfamily protein [Pseudomonas paraeruginosa]MBG3905177.1 MFS transporter [Pseudomonas aeruginosa]MBG4066412.1 MFS transporter [Pseudomonas aeruginosa]